MRKIMIGYGLSLLSAGCFLATVYELALLCMRGIVLAIIPAVICLIFSVFIAWMIGDMSWNYGEEEEGK